MVKGSCLPKYLLLYCKGCTCTDFFFILSWRVHFFAENMWRICTVCETCTVQGDQENEVLLQHAMCQDMLSSITLILALKPLDTSDGAAFEASHVERQVHFALSLD